MALGALVNILSGENEHAQSVQHLEEVKSCKGNTHIQSPSLKSAGLSKLLLLVECFNRAYAAKLQLMSSSIYKQDVQ